MTIDSVVISPLIALIAGILILLMPRLLNYVVAFYLIAIGIIGLGIISTNRALERNPGLSTGLMGRIAAG